MRGKDEGLYSSQTHLQGSALWTGLFIYLFQDEKDSCRPRRSIGKFVVAEKTRDWNLASSPSLLGGTYQKLKSEFLPLSSAVCYSSTLCTLRTSDSSRTSLQATFHKYPICCPSSSCGSHVGHTFCMRHKE